MNQRATAGCCDSVIARYRLILRSPRDVRLARSPLAKTGECRCGWGMAHRRLAISQPPFTRRSGLTCPLPGIGRLNPSLRVSLCRLPAHVGPCVRQLPQYPCPRLRRRPIKIAKLKCAQPRALPIRKRTWAMNVATRRRIADRDPITRGRLAALVRRMPMPHLAGATVNFNPMKEKARIHQDRPIAFRLPPVRRLQ